jgi:hypothetical protein
VAITELGTNTLFGVLAEDARAPVLAEAGA